MNAAEQSPPSSATGRPSANGAPSAGSPPVFPADGYRALVEQLPAISYIVGLGDVNRIMYVSPQVERYLGFTARAWAADPELWIRQLHPDDRERVLEVLRQKTAAGEPFSLEHRFVARDGRVLWFRNHAVYLRDESGAVRYAYGVMMDVSEQHQAAVEKAELQTHLVQSQRLEAVGKLANGIAHDFNNLLTIIEGHAQVSMMVTNESDPLYEVLNKINAAAERAADLTRKLLMFCRRRPAEHKVLDLNELVRDLLKILRRVLGEDVHVDTVLAADLWRVNGDATSIEQVIMNLALNARDALMPGGQIVVRTENAVVTGSSGRFVCLSITGSMVRAGGTAAAPARELDGGAAAAHSLGIAIVYAIAQQHGGWVTASNGSSGATTFMVYFPACAEPETPHPASPGAATAVPGRHEQVLLVEDDETVREMVAGILRQNGYTVFEAGTGAEACAIFSKHAAAIHLVFCDLVLPDMPGVEVIGTLKACNPGTKVLVTTGYGAERTPLIPPACQHYRFLKKPYSVADLLRAMREVIDAPASA